MVRGLKKKLLIGLLSAAVVGTSLAPNVPLVGSFAQEVKAQDEGVGETEKVESISAIVDHYNYTIESVAAPVGYIAGGSEKYYEDKKGTKEIISGTGDKNLTTAYQRFTKEGAQESDPDYYEYVAVDVKSNPIYALPEIPTNAIDDKLYTDSTCKTPVSDGNIPATLYYKVKDTSKAELTIEDSKTDKPEKSDDVKVNTPNVVQEGEATKVVTMDAGTGIGKAVIKVNKDVIVKAVLSLADSVKGKKITKVEATYKKTDGTTATVEGTFDEATKEASFALGKIVQETTITITATVEDIKVNPTLDTSRLKDATAAFAGETNVKQIGGQLTVEVTPTEASNLDALMNKIAVKFDGGSNFDVTKSGGKLVYTSVGDIPSASPVVIVSGGLDNTKGGNVGKDYAKVEAPYDVSIDNEEVLAAYKALHPDSDKNSAVVIKAATSEAMPEAFNAAAETERIKNENIEFALNIHVEVLGGETADNATQAEATDAKTGIDEFKTPITIKALLPRAAQGKGGYIVYREHEGKIEKITSFQVNGNEIAISTTKLSDFTVLYDKTLTSDSQPEPEPIVPDEDKPDENKPDTPVTPNPTVKPADTKAATSTKAAKATTSTKKSSKTSSPKTADYAVNSLLALLTGAAGLFGITLINKKRKEDEE